MDAVILAGGRGTRLSVFAGPYRKPLLAWRGVSLVQHAVNVAHIAGVDRPVVVVSPENCAEICQVLERSNVEVIVQRKSRGPGHALLTGLQVAPPHRSDRVLVLLADNVSTADDVDLVARHRTAVGTKYVDREDVKRFTFYDNGEWREKVEPNSQDARLRCWIGPFIGVRSYMTYVLDQVNRRTRIGDEVTIGPHLNGFMHDGHDVLVTVNTLDVGTLESYLNGGE